MDSKKCFNHIVNKLSSHLEGNNLKAMIVEMSGSLNSTLISIIGREVFLKTGIPVIGVSLPSSHTNSNKLSLANFASSNICNLSMEWFIDQEVKEIIGRLQEKDKVEISNDELNNIESRIRAIYLTYVASQKNGIVLGSKSLTEKSLGQYTIGDVNMYEPIIGLYNTELYELADYLISTYSLKLKQYNLISSSYSKYSIISDIIRDIVKLFPITGNNDASILIGNNYEKIDYILKGIYDKVSEEEIKLVQDCVATNEYKLHIPYSITRHDLKEYIKQ